MSHAIVHGVFPNNTMAGAALEALKNAGFAPGQISVIGQDCDSFRQATATLVSVKGDKFILWAGVAGAILGGLAGLYGMPQLPRADELTLTMVPIWAAFTGTAIGISAGFTIGGILKIDDGPRFESEVRLGTVHDGELALSVEVSDLDELHLVQSTLIGHSATNVSIDTPPDFMAIPQAVHEQAITELTLVAEAAA